MNKMTKEEKAELELQKAQAKQRCKEVHHTVEHIKEILADYQRDYYRWRRRFEEADRKLALEEKLTKLPGPGERKNKVPDLEMKLTKAQIIAIAEELGVLEELNFEED